MGALLSQAANLEEAVDVVSDVLVSKLAKSLMVATGGYFFFFLCTMNPSLCVQEQITNLCVRTPTEDIEVTRPISGYGVDSLLAVELRAWIFSEIKAEVSVFELLSNEPITALARKIATKSKAVPEAFVNGGS